MFGAHMYKRVAQQTQRIINDINDSVLRAPFINMVCLQS